MKLSETAARTLVSAFVVGILGFQLLISTISLPLASYFDRGVEPRGIQRLIRSPTFWPFINYPMYSLARYEGDRIPSTNLVAEYADGTRIVVDQDRLDMSEFHLTMVERGIRSGDPATIRTVRELLTRAPGDEPIAILVESRDMILRREGIERTLPEVLTRVDTR